MSRTEEHVRLRKPCPCGQGQILLIFHLPSPDGEAGYFLPPDVVRPMCVNRYHVHYPSEPDRVELSPIDDKGHSSSGDMISYLVEPLPPPHLGEVDHA